MYVKYRLKYRQVSNWRFDVWLHPFELFTQAVSYQRSVSTTSLVKSIFWKLCYTTLFQLIYPTRKKVKRMFTKRRKLGIGSQKSHGLGRDFLELQLLQFFFYNKRAFFLLCYIWGNCLRFLQPPLPPLSLYRWSVGFSEPVTRVNLQTLKIWLLIFPPAATHFLVNWVWEFGARSRTRLLPDKFEYSHYQFADNVRKL